MSDVLINPVMSKEKKVNVWVERFAYAGMIAFITIAFLLAVSILYNTYFNSPPALVVSQDGVPTEPLCPGQRFDIHNHVVIKSQMMLYIYLSVMDKEMTHNFEGTQVSLPPRIHPQPSEFNQMIPWIVPDLPPGDYVRAISMRGYVDSEKPLFLTTHFSIGDKQQCNARLK
jgi:hypothetical protein